MSSKIKLHTFNVLFQLFAYLADKTGGWRVFVRPKLLLGSLIVGLGLTSCGTKTEKKETEESTSINKTQDPKDSIKSDEDKDKIWCYVIDPIAYYPGGDGELMTFLSKNIKYPEKAIEKKIEGKVFLSIVIDSTGVIRDVSVLRSLEPACDKEAIRVVKLLPKWIPGKKDGKNVNVSYILPVIFKLPKK